MSLRNRVALVTGGSRGIGRGIAVRLAKDGARVAIAYRTNKAAAQQTLLQLQASGADCVAVHIGEQGLIDFNGLDQVGRDDVQLDGAAVLRRGNVDTIDRDIAVPGLGSADLDIFPFALIALQRDSGQAAKRVGDVCVRQARNHF